jgi:hypothetical protein
LFADDTLIWVEGIDIEVICEVLNSELKNLSENKHKLNVAKKKKKNV